MSTNSENTLDKSIRTRVNVILHLIFCTLVDLCSVQIKDAPLFQIHVIRTDRVWIEIPGLPYWRNKYDGGAIVIELGNIEH